MKIRDGLAGLNVGGNNIGTPGFKFQTGRVYGVVMDETTPSSEMFEQVGGWDGLGTIFYLDYEQSKSVSVISPHLCKKAIPFFPNQKYYPLLGEIVLLFDLPSFNSQSTGAGAVTQKYYISTINLWNNNHHNAQPADPNASLGNTFVENGDIRTLRPFEGDYILEGRFGNSLRFGSTSKINTNENFWSKTGNDGDPITIITNGHTPNGKPGPYVENLNNDGSAIYLTTTQQIPLNVIKDKLNPLNSTTLPNKYNSGTQVIVQADRVVLHARKENVMLFSTNNIELYAKQTVSFDADEKVVLNSPRIFLGLDGNDAPTEPVLLGGETIKLLNKLLSEVSKFCDKLTTAITPPQGSPMVDVNVAAAALKQATDSMIPKLKQIKSSKVRVAK
jgi:hypothetical protein